MRDESFADLVALEIKNHATEEQKAYLRLPENWNRWQRAIQALIDNLDRQLAGITQQEQRQIEAYTDMPDAIAVVSELMAEFDYRRKKIERFRFHVLRRLDEVSALISNGSEEIEERAHTVEMLRRAIQKHREMMDEFDLDPTPIDKALWAVLNGEWKFDTITESEITNFVND